MDLTRPIRALACGLVLIAVGCRSAAPNATAGDETLRVLFIGNSLTSANDLPRTLAELGRVAGEPIIVASVARPNYALIDHLVAPTASEALARIGESRWTHVVVQQGPTSRAIDADTLVLATRMLAAPVRASGARAALYMVWPALRDSANFDRIRESYRRAACAVDGSFWPVGEAWRAARARQPGLALYDADDFHPAPLGTYLAAVVMYERVSGRDGRRLPDTAVVNGVALTTPPATVRLLQEVAHATNARFERACDAARPARPFVIAHRGASGHRPEHTIAAYSLAIAMGADFIEPDLVSTRDGVLVARHENEIGGTTDVAAKFPERRTTRTIDGAAVTGWFTEDFTLAELRTLRARERLPFRSRAHDGVEGIPTFADVIDLAERESRARGRTIGVYPETKHPTYFRSIGLPLEEPLLAELERRGWTTKDAPVVIQSFEVGNLRRLRARTGVRLAQLVSASGGPFDLVSERNDLKSYAAMLTERGLRTIAGYANAIGAEKSLVQPVDSAGALSTPTTLVADAHRAGLDVHVWTLRSDPSLLPRAYAGDPAAEWRRFAALGVDGIFGDFPDVGVSALSVLRR